jgi:transposase
MAIYVGLEVSVNETSICIMDDKGLVAARTDISTDPDLIAGFISKHPPKVERVVHESGILAIWWTRELEKRGVPIICIDARLAHKALSGRINKSDQGPSRRCFASPAGQWTLKDWLSWRASRALLGNALTAGDCRQSP